MRQIHLLDTGVFCGLLGVFPEPGVVTEMNRLMAVTTGQTLLVPMGVILETGNHLAQLKERGKVRPMATRFVELLEAGFANEAPWTPTPLPGKEEIRAWLAEFPARADAGVGLVDLSLIKLWEEECRRHPNAYVRIWSLDEHLTGYEQRPAGSLS